MSPDMRNAICMGKSLQMREYWNLTRSLLRHNSLFRNEPLCPHANIVCIRLKGVLTLLMCIGQSSSRTPTSHRISPFRGVAFSGVEWCGVKHTTKLHMAPVTGALRTLCVSL